MYFNTTPTLSDKFFSSVPDFNAIRLAHQWIGTQELTAHSELSLPTMMVEDYTKTKIGDINLLIACLLYPGMCISICHKGLIKVNIKEPGGCFYITTKDYNALDF